MYMFCVNQFSIKEPASLKESFNDTDRLKPLHTQRYSL